jgi:N4-gp56 family major capsid protein
MAGQQWQVNADGGFLSNEELSKQIRHVAQPLMQFRQFVRPDSAVGKQKGNTFDFDRVSNVATAGGALQEGVAMPETKVTISQSQLTITEYGNSVPYTGKLEALAKFSPSNVVTVALKNDMAKVLDSAAAGQFTGCKVKYTPTGTTSAPTGTIDTDGTVSTAATRNIAVYDVEEVRDYLKSTLKAPAYDGRNYMGIGSTGLLRAIQRDRTEFQTAAQYGDPELLFAGEVGRIRGVRWVEETNVLANSLGTTSYKGEGVVFGEDPVVEGVAIAEEVRAKIAGDYGRDKGVAWYFLGGWKEVWDTANAGEARIIHITST